MEENKELEEKQIPGQENNVSDTENVSESTDTENIDTGVDVETGTTESGENTEDNNIGDEAATEDTPVEENVESDVTENNDVVDESEQELESEEESEQGEKMLTQSQVNELVGKARAEGRAAGKAEAMRELYDRYGVNDDNEMNDIFGKGQGYDLLNDEYETVNGNYKNVSAENALLKSGIVASRWDDVKAILGNKGMDITVDNIQAELATHPEWQGVGDMMQPQGKEFTPAMGEQLAQNTNKNITPGLESEKTGTIRKFGSNVPESKEGLEEADVKKLFSI